MGGGGGGKGNKLFFECLVNLFSVTLVIFFDKNQHDLNIRLALSTYTGTDCRSLAYVCRGYGRKHTGVYIH
jgi:hypothetical protein